MSWKCLLRILSIADHDRFESSVFADALPSMGE